MKAKGAKKKGNRYENAIVEIIRELDGDAHRTYGSGAGLDKADIIAPSLKLEIEVKNQSQWQLATWLKQMEEQRTAYNTPCIIARDPKTPEKDTGNAIVVMRLSDWINFFQLDKTKDCQYCNAEVGRIRRVKIDKAIYSLKDLLKEL